MDPETLTREPDAAEAPPFAAASPRWRFGLRHMLFAVFYCALAFWLLRVVRVPIVVVALVLFALASAGFSVVVARRRSTQQEGLIWMLAVAAEHGMPLPPALEAFSGHAAGNYRRQVHALAQALSEGLSLPEALDRLPGLLPRDVEILARAGWESGCLAGAFREAGASRGGLRPVWAEIAGRVGYFAGVIYLLQVIAGFLFFFVVPKFEAILSDFGIAPPAITVALFRAERWLNGRQGLVPGWALLLGLMAVELVIFVALAWSLSGWAPPLDRLFARRHTALILRSLAWMVEGGVPLTRGVERLAAWYSTGWVRVRLERMAQDVAHGGDWLDSLAYHGLVRRADAALLRAARRAGNLPWALRQAAEAGERRLAYRLHAVLQVLSPMLVLALGALIGLVAVAYFAPLVKVIEGLVP